MSVILPMTGPLASAEFKLPETYAAYMQFAIKVYAMRYYVDSVKAQMGNYSPICMFEIGADSGCSLPSAFVLVHSDGNGCVSSIEYTSHDGNGKYVNVIRTSDTAQLCETLDRVDPCSLWRRAIDELHLVEFGGTGLLELLSRRPK